jgi:trimethylamine-N-oxide reductase (cytochrome c)
MFWSGCPNWSDGKGDGFNKMNFHAHPKMEFIVYQHMYMEKQCNMADILLPVAHPNELDDIANHARFDAYESLVIKRKVSPPKGESVSDFECCCRVAEKLGFIDEITEGLGHDGVVEKWFREAYDKCGYTDFISWEDLWEHGGYNRVVDEAQYSDPQATSSYRFYMDPEKNPLTMPSGKLEYESQNLKNIYPNDQERPPVAKWIRGGR